MIEVLKQALEALETTWYHVGTFAPTDDAIELYDQARTSLRQAIAELESQEPVAHLWECLGRWSAYLVDNGTQADCAPPQWLVDAIKNATAPPQRTWIELTDDEYFALQMKIKTPMISVQDYIDAMRMVEQASKEKNT